MDLHHVHIFASDIDKTLAWWRDKLSAQIIFDGSLSGTRNVFVTVGTGRIHFYSQPPRGTGPSAVHHLGIKVKNLKTEWPRLQGLGVTSPHGLREFEGWRYVMIEAPDCVLLELFEFDKPWTAID